MIDDGDAIAYSALARGTPVYASDEVQVGIVDEVLDNVRERIFDGLVIRTDDGELRFVDAPEVRRTAERGVTLSIDSAEARQLGPPEVAVPEYQANPGAGRIARFFGRGWKRR